MCSEPACAMQLTGDSAFILILVRCTAQSQVGIGKCILHRVRFLSIIYTNASVFAPSEPCPGRGPQSRADWASCLNAQAGSKGPPLPIAKEEAWDGTRECGV